MTENLLSACTLPTLEQPLRRKEFDDFFADDVLEVTRPANGQVRLVLRPDPAVAARAAALAAKETQCCSFFAFELAIGDGSLTMRISVAEQHEPVLGALAARAEARR